MANGQNGRLVIYQGEKFQADKGQVNEMVIWQNGKFMKLQLIGGNLCRVFNARSGQLQALHLKVFFRIKLSNLRLKTQPKPLLGKYLQYWCEARDFVHLRDNMRWNFIKTESFRPRKTSWNTVNFCYILQNCFPNFHLYSQNLQRFSQY